MVAADLACGFSWYRCCAYLVHKNVHWGAELYVWERLVFIWECVSRVFTSIQTSLKPPSLPL